MNKPLKFVAACRLPTEWGVFTLHGFEEVRSGQEHVALSMGDIGSDIWLWLRRFCSPRSSSSESQCGTSCTRFSQPVCAVRLGRSVHACASSSSSTCAKAAPCCAKRNK